MAQFNIVTTFLLPNTASAVSILTSFIKYHCSIGFQHFFLFYDGSEGQFKEQGLNDVIDRYADEITIRYQGAELIRDLQAFCPLLWQSMGKSSYAVEVPIRQSLHASYAAHLLESQEIPSVWLLHIDIDELFLYTSTSNIKDHFNSLQEKGINHMTYLNHEGVPESTQVLDYFKEVTLFRMNHHSVPVTPSTQSALMWWSHRRKHGQYLIAYDNGKSAVCIKQDKSNGLIEARTVHTFTHSLKGGTALKDYRTCNDKEVFLPCTDPCILHYVACGLNHLVEKYRILGNFPPSWTTATGSIPIAPCFHLDAQDAYIRHNIESLYIGEVQAPSKETIDDHIRCGILSRQTFPQAVLGNEGEESLPGESLLSSSSAITLTSRTLQSVEEPPFSMSRAWLLSNISQQYL